MKSILKGLACNLGAYNSPFALSIDGQFRFHDPYTFGWTVFGPLFYEFITWVHKTVKAEGIRTIAFLAREGYIFRQLFQIIYGDRALSSLYLLTSRRAVSVAAIRSEEDILEILRRDYDGSLRNLLISRLGYPESKAEKISDRQLHFREGASDDDFSKTIEKIREIFPEILAYAEEERREYVSYLDRSIPELKTDPGRVLLVDIGYSGTIQYWMSRLLNRPVQAAYLAVFQENQKLKEGDSKVYSMYGPEESSDPSEFIHEIEGTQLFLESVLQAPFGQLIRFRDGEPVYREEAEPSSGIRSLQDGILDYARDRAGLEAVRFGSSDGLPEEIQSEDQRFMEENYRTFVHQPLTENLASIFSVDDNYSQDTCLHLDPKTGRWII